MFDLKKQEHSNLLQQANNISNKKYETSSANNTNGKHQSNNDLIHRQKSTSIIYIVMIIIHLHCYCNKSIDEMNSIELQPT